MRCGGIERRLGIWHQPQAYTVVTKFFLEDDAGFLNGPGWDIETIGADA